MKRLIVALLLVVGVAHAQVMVAGGGPVTPCGTPVPPHTTWLDIDALPFTCAPDNLATTFVRFTAGKGAVAWWACTKADGKIGKNIAAVTIERFGSSTLGLDIGNALMGPPDQILSRLNALLDKNRDTAWSAPVLAAVWCPYEVELVTFLNGAPPAAPPPPPIPAVKWVVAKYSVQVSRPAFTVVGGAIGPQSTTRAPVGIPCDSSGPAIAVGTTTYYPWAGSGGLVAVCVKQ